MTNHLHEITVPLLAWYRSNARDLPWRNTDDPYRIWVSEIMLQQTRVAAVIDYYARFLEAFPTVQALAYAPEDRLLKLWEGLGYYNRARNMQKAAVTVTEEYGGHFPHSYDELLALSGIGEYTAGAIASAAFGSRAAAVDGNVLRVLSRLLDDHSDIADAATKKRFRKLLTEILPEGQEDMRIFNQAMMELGAVICVPNGAPKCSQCPVQAHCMAYERETALELPVKQPKKKRRVEEKTVFLLMREQQVALRKRETQGLLAGLWEYPSTEGHLDERAVYAHLQDLGLSVTAWEKQLKAKHIFTHIEWHMTAYLVQVMGEGPGELLWADRERFSQYAIPSAFSKFTNEIHQIFKKQNA